MAGGLIGILVWVALLSMFRQRDANNRPGQPNLALALVVALCTWLFIGPLAAELLRRLLAGHWQSAPSLLLCLVILFPWPIARHLLLPLGLPRATFVVALLCSLRFWSDRRGGAALLSAWALLRRPRRHGYQGHDEGAMQFLEARLHKAKRLRGAGVAAAALLAVRRGEAAVARGLLLCIESMDPAMCPPRALAIGREWRSVDAVARGEWAEVARLSRLQGARSPLSRFLGACADRFVRPPDGASPPHRFMLWLRWALAPYRQASWPLLQRALQAAPSVTTAQEAEVAAGPAAGGDLASALLHLAWLLRLPVEQVDQAALLDVGRAWDRALTSEATLRRTRERALVLRVAGGEAVLTQLSAQVVAALAELLRGSRVGLSALIHPEAGRQASAVLGRAARTVRDQLLEELELSGDALRVRTAEQRALPRLDEWREWAALHARYDRAVVLGGEELRRLAWSKLNRDLCNWAVWLWNIRSERTLANAVFRWLLAEAEHLADERTVALQKKNVACGP